jgi:hypothetical protein
MLHARGKVFGRRTQHSSKRRRRKYRLLLALIGKRILFLLLLLFQIALWREIFLWQQGIPDRHFVLCATNSMSQKSGKLEIDFQFKTGLPPSDIFQRYTRCAHFFFFSIWPPGPFSIRPRSFSSHSRTWSFLSKTQQLAIMVQKEEKQQTGTMDSYKTADQTSKISGIF